MIAPLLLSVAAVAAPCADIDSDPDPDLRTVAEATAYQCTATSAETHDLVMRLAASDPRAHATTFGASVKGKPLDLLIVADPPVTDAAGAHADDRLVVLVIGNIHSGETCGKAASLMFARDLLARDDARLDDVILLVAPNYNPDGNDEMDPNNRPGQIGPCCGMGQRPNAQGLDLNRDWVKLDSPEAQAMVALLTAWDPHLTIDTHTTNGSQHRYALTYAHPLNPAGFEPSIAFIRDGLLPRVTKELSAQYDEDAFFYGNFDRAHETWSTYSAQPRFGTPYRGLRGQMSILSEAYAYIDFEARVRVTYHFLDAIVADALDHAETVRALHDQAKAETIARGANPQPDDLIGVRFAPAAAPRKATILGYALEPDAEGRLRPGTVPHDYRVVHRDRFVATRAVPRPHAYVIEPGHDAVVAKLRQHGIRVEPYRGAASVQSWTIDEVTHAERAFQNHHVARVEATARDGALRADECAWLVPVAQPLGTLAVFLLEPECEDGLVAWNFFDPVLKPGARFPVHRVRGAADLAPAPE